MGLEIQFNFDNQFSLNIMFELLVILY